MDGLYLFNRNPDFAPYAVAGLAYAREGYSDTNKNNNLLAKVGLGDWVISAGLNIALCAKAQTPAPYLT